MLKQLRLRHLRSKNLNKKNSLLEINVCACLIWHKAHRECFRSNYDTGSCSLVNSATISNRPARRRICGATCRCPSHCSSWWQSPLAHSVSPSGCFQSLHNPAEEERESGSLNRFTQSQSSHKQQGRTVKEGVGSETSCVLLSTLWDCKNMEGVYFISFLQDLL